MPAAREIWRHPVPELTGWHRRLIMRSMLGTFGKDILGVHGAERLRTDQDAFILAINHTTRIEALLLPILFAYLRQGRLISFIADWNFALIPGVGTILRSGESILLVRKPAKPAILNVLKPWFLRNGSAYARAERALESGRSVGVFPEGTANRHPTRLLRGFDGAARLSLATGRPVLPVGVRFPGHPKSRPVPDRTPMEVFVGEPMHPQPAEAGMPREQVREWHKEIMQAIARLSGKTWDAASTRRKHSWD